MTRKDSTRNYEPAATSVQPDATNQILKARVIAHGIEEGMHLKVLQNHGLFLIRSLHPDKCLFFVTKSQIGIHKSRGRNVAFLLTSFQFLHKAYSLGLPSGLRVRMD